ncbi:MAG: glycogen/starch/alpha-glucan phosphorylase, partial [Bacteroidales bacterium]
AFWNPLLKQLADGKATPDVGSDFLKIDANLLGQEKLNELIHNVRVSNVYPDASELVSWVGWAFVWAGLVIAAGLGAMFIFSERKIIKNRLSEENKSTPQAFIATIKNDHQKLKRYEQLDPVQVATINNNKLRFRRGWRNSPVGRRLKEAFTITAQGPPIGNAQIWLTPDIAQEKASGRKYLGQTTYDPSTAAQIIGLYPILNESSRDLKNLISTRKPNRVADYLDEFVARILKFDHAIGDLCLTVCVDELLHARGQKQDHKELLDFLTKHEFIAFSCLSVFPKNDPYSENEDALIYQALDIDISRVIKVNLDGSEPLKMTKSDIANIVIFTGNCLCTAFRELGMPTREMISLFGDLRIKRLHRFYLKESLKRLRERGFGIYTLHDQRLIDHLNAYREAHSARDIEQLKEVILVPYAGWYIVIFPYGYAPGLGLNYHAMVLPRQCNYILNSIAEEMKPKDIEAINDEYSLGLRLAGPELPRETKELIIFDKEDQRNWRTLSRMALEGPAELAQTCFMQSLYETYGRMAGISLTELTQKLNTFIYLNKTPILIFEGRLHLSLAWMLAFAKELGWAETYISEGKDVIVVHYNEEDICITPDPAEPISVNGQPHYLWHAEAGPAYRDYPPLTQLEDKDAIFRAINSNAWVGAERNKIRPQNLTPEGLSDIIHMFSGTVPKTKLVNGILEAIRAEAQRLPFASEADFQSRMNGKVKGFGPGIVSSMSSVLDFSDFSSSGIRPKLLAVYDPHTFRRHLEAVLPVLQEGIDLAQAEHRNCVFIVEDFGTEMPDANLDDPFFRSVIAEGSTNAKFLQQLQDFFEREKKDDARIYSRRIVFLSADRSLHPAQSRIDEHAKGLQEFFDRNPQVNIVGEDITFDAWAYRMRALIAMKQAGAVDINHLEDFHKYLKYMIYCQAKSYALRDAQVHRQIEGIVRDNPNTLVIVLRGGLHNRMHEGLAEKGIDVRVVEMILTPGLPVMIGPVNWLAYKYMHDKSDLSPEELKFAELLFQFVGAMEAAAEDQSVEDVYEMGERTRELLISRCNLEEGFLNGIETGVVCASRFVNCLIKYLFKNSRASSARQLLRGLKFDEHRRYFPEGIVLAAPAFRTDAIHRELRGEDLSRIMLKETHVLSNGTRIYHVDEEGAIPLSQINTQDAWVGAEGAGAVVSAKEVTCAGKVDDFGLSLLSLVEECPEGEKISLSCSPKTQEQLEIAQRFGFACPVAVEEVMSALEKQIKQNSRKRPSLKINSLQGTRRHTIQFLLGPVQIDGKATDLLTFFTPLNATNRFATALTRLNVSDIKTLLEQGLATVVQWPLVIRSREDISALAGHIGESVERVESVFISQAELRNMEISRRRQEETAREEETFRVVLAQIEGLEQAGQLQEALALIDAQSNGVKKALNGKKGRLMVLVEEASAARRKAEREQAIAAAQAQVNELLEKGFWDDAWEAAQEAQKLLEEVPARARAAVAEWIPLEQRRELLGIVDRCKNLALQFERTDDYKKRTAIWYQLGKLCIEFANKISLFPQEVQETINQRAHQLALRSVSEFEGSQWPNGNGGLLAVAKHIHTEPLRARPRSIGLLTSDNALLEKDRNARNLIGIFRVAIIELYDDQHSSHGRAVLSRLSGKNTGAAEDDADSRRAQVHVWAKTGSTLSDEAQAQIHQLSVNLNGKMADAGLETDPERALGILREGFRPFLEAEIGLPKLLQSGDREYPSFMLTRMINRLGALPMMSPAELADKLRNNPILAKDATTTRGGHTVIRVFMDNEGEFTAPICPTNVIELYPLEPGNPERTIGLKKAQAMLANWDAALDTLRASSWQGEGLRFYAAGIDYDFNTQEAFDRLVDTVLPETPAGQRRQLAANFWGAHEELKNEPIATPSLNENYMDAISKRFFLLLEYFSHCNVYHPDDPQVKTAARDCIRLLTEPVYRDIYLATSLCCVAKDTYFNHDYLMQVASSDTMSQDTLRMCLRIISEMAEILEEWEQIEGRKTVYAPWQVIATQPDRAMQEPQPQEKQAARELWQHTVKFLLETVEAEMVLHEDITKACFALDTDGRIVSYYAPVILPALGFRTFVPLEGIADLLEREGSYLSAEVIAGNDRLPPVVVIHLNAEEGWRFSVKFESEGNPEGEETRLRVLLYDGRRLIREDSAYQELVKDGKLAVNSSGQILLAEALRGGRAKIALGHVLADGKQLSKALIAFSGCEHSHFVSSGFLGGARRLGKARMQAFNIENAVPRLHEEKVIRDARAYAQTGDFKTALTIMDAGINSAEDNSRLSKERQALVWMSKKFEWAFEVDNLLRSGTSTKILNRMVNKLGELLFGEGPEFTEQMIEERVKTESGLPIIWQELKDARLKIRRRELLKEAEKLLKKGNFPAARQQVEAAIAEGGEDQNSQQLLNRIDEGKNIRSLGDSLQALEAESSSENLSSQDLDNLSVRLANARLVMQRLPAGSSLEKFEARADKIQQTLEVRREPLIIEEVSRSLAELALRTRELDSIAELREIEEECMALQESTALVTSEARAAEREDLEIRIADMLAGITDFIERSRVPAAEVQSAQREIDSCIVRLQNWPVDGRHGLLETKVKPENLAMVAEAGQLLARLDTAMPGVKEYFERAREKLWQAVDAKEVKVIRADVENFYREIEDKLKGPALALKDLQMFEEVLKDNFTEETWARLSAEERMHFRGWGRSLLRIIEERRAVIEGRPIKRERTARRAQDFIPEAVSAKPSRRIQPVRGSRTRGQKPGFSSGAPRGQSVDKRKSKGHKGSLDAAVRHVLEARERQDKPAEDRALEEVSVLFAAKGAGLSPADLSHYRKLLFGSAVVIFIIGLLLLSVFCDFSFDNMLKTQHLVLAGAMIPARVTEDRRIETKASHRLVNQPLIPLVLLQQLSRKDTKAHVQAFRLNEAFDKFTRKLKDLTSRIIEEDRLARFANFIINKGDLSLLPIIEVMERDFQGEPYAELLRFLKFANNSLSVVRIKSFPIQFLAQVRSGEKEASRIKGKRQAKAIKRKALTPVGRLYEILQKMINEEPVKGADKVKTDALVEFCRQAPKEAHSAWEELPPYLSGQLSPELARHIEAIIEKHANGKTHTYPFSVPMAIHEQLVARYGARDLARVIFKQDETGKWSYSIKEKAPEVDEAQLTKLLNFIKGYTEHSPPTTINDEFEFLFTLDPAKLRSNGTVHLGGVARPTETITCILHFYTLSLAPIVQEDVIAHEITEFNAPHDVACHQSLVYFTAYPIKLLQYRRAIEASRLIPDKDFQAGLDFVYGTIKNRFFVLLYRKTLSLHGSLRRLLGFGSPSVAGGDHDPCAAARLPISGASILRKISAEDLSRNCLITYLNSHGYAQEADSLTDVLFLRDDAAIYLKEFNRPIIAAWMAATIGEALAKQVYLVENPQEREEKLVYHVSETPTKLTLWDVREASNAWIGAQEEGAEQTAQRMLFGFCVMGLTDENQPEARRAYFAKYLGDLGNRGAVEPLAKLLESAQPWVVHLAAIDALKKLNDPSAIGSLKKLLSEEHLDSYLYTRARELLRTLTLKVALPSNCLVKAIAQVMGESPEEVAQLVFVNSQEPCINEHELAGSDMPLKKALQIVFNELGHLIRGIYRCSCCNDYFIVFDFEDLDFNAINISPVNGNRLRWHAQAVKELNMERIPVLDEGRCRAAFIQAINEIPQGAKVGAQEAKERELRRAVEKINGRDIFVLQMEYEFSLRFLQGFAEYLEKVKGCTREDAVYNTGELAKILMAGGLGSFKPDLVQGWYDTLSKYWGSLEARNRLHVMGVLYAEAIKGQGAIKPRGAVAQENLVDIARSLLLKVKTYKDVEVNANGISTVDVDIYMNPYSELDEYWMYCPQVFHEAYCGGSDDDYRAIQTLLYRKVLLRFVKEHVQAQSKLLFSTSEINTTLAIPVVVEDEFTHDPVFNDLQVHHYNHTIVPEGMPHYCWYMFEALKIAERFKGAIHDGFVDLVMITGEVSEVITGCSSLHTKILREHIFKDFAAKVVEDDLFGNSEGSYINRWQGTAIQDLIRILMRRLRVASSDYAAFFRELEKKPNLKKRFIEGLLGIKRQQKQAFIDELYKGSFGDVAITSEDLAGAGTSLIDRPFFTFVRRFVDYKCGDLIVDILYDPSFRERVVRSGAVILIGGRKFGSFADIQQRRIQELIRIDPRMRYHIIFITNHNVFTSWLIQQGTDFGGMLSWKGKEAGPTSFCNAQQNGAPTFASLDGVIPERVTPIDRDPMGRILSGTGYIVDYGQERSYSGDIKPDRECFMRKLEEACRDYFDPDNYGRIALNALEMGMLAGDIRNQAKGLIRVWAGMAEKKTAVPQDPSAEGKTRAEINAFVEQMLGIETIIQFYGEFTPEEVAQKYGVAEAHMRRLLEIQVRFVRGPPELGVANYVKNQIIYILIPDNASPEQVQHEIQAVLNPDKDHKEILGLRQPIAIVGKIVAHRDGTYTFSLSGGYSVTITDWRNNTVRVVGPGDKILHSKEIPVEVRAIILKAIAAIKEQNSRRKETQDPSAALIALLSQQAQASTPAPRPQPRPQPKPVENNNEIIFMCSDGSRIVLRANGKIKIQMLIAQDKDSPDAKREYQDMCDASGPQDFANVGEDASSIGTKLRIMIANPDKWILAVNERWRKIMPKNWLRYLDAGWKKRPDLSADGDEALTREQVDGNISEAIAREPGHVILDDSSDEAQAVKAFFGVGQNPGLDRRTRLFERIARYLSTVSLEIHNLRTLPHRGYWQIEREWDGTFILRIFVRDIAFHYADGGLKEDNTDIKKIFMTAFQAMTVHTKEFMNVLIHEISAAITATFPEPVSGEIRPISHESNLAIEAYHCLLLKELFRNWRNKRRPSDDFQFPGGAMEEIIGLCAGEIDLTAEDAESNLILGPRQDPRTLLASWLGDLPWLNSRQTESFAHQLQTMGIRTPTELAATELSRLVPSRAGVNIKLWQLWTLVWNCAHFSANQQLVQYWDSPQRYLNISQKALEASLKHPGICFLDFAPYCIQAAEALLAAGDFDSKDLKALSDDLHRVQAEICRSCKLKERGKCPAQIASSRKALFEELNQMKHRLFEQNSREGLFRLLQYKVVKRDLAGTERLIAKIEGTLNDVNVLLLKCPAQPTEEERRKLQDLKNSFRKAVLAKLQEFEVGPEETAKVEWLIDEFCENILKHSREGLGKYSAKSQDIFGVAILKVARQEQGIRVEFTFQDNGGASNLETLLHKVWACASPQGRKQECCRGIYMALYYLFGKSDDGKLDLSCRNKRLSFVGFDEASLRRTTVVREDYPYPGFLAQFGFAISGKAGPDLSADGDKALTAWQVGRITGNALRTQYFYELGEDSDIVRLLRNFFGVTPDTEHSERVKFYKRIAALLRKVKIEIYVFDELPHAGYWKYDKKNNILKLFIRKAESIAPIIAHEVIAGLSAETDFPCDHDTNCQVQEHFVHWINTRIDSIPVFITQKSRRQIAGLEKGKIDPAAADSGAQPKKLDLGNPIKFATSIDAVLSGQLPNPAERLAEIIFSEAKLSAVVNDSEPLLMIYHALKAGQELEIGGRKAKVAIVARDKKGMGFGDKEDIFVFPMLVQAKTGQLYICLNVTRAFLQQDDYELVAGHICASLLRHAFNLDESGIRNILQRPFAELYPKDKAPQEPAPKPVPKAALKAPKPRQDNGNYQYRRGPWNGQLCIAAPVIAYAFLHPVFLVILALLSIYLLFNCRFADSTRKITGNRGCSGTVTKELASFVESQIRRGRREELERF